MIEAKKMQPHAAALINHKAMIAQKFNSKHKSRLRSTITSFHERGYTAFDYHNYPLQAYICYGIGVTNDKAAIFQNKLCKQGHIWKDTILSSRCNSAPYNCFICTKVRHMKVVNSGEYAEKRKKNYAKNAESHNAECLQRYHANKERIKAEGKKRRLELRELVNSGELSRFKEGKECKHCKTTLKYTLAHNCVECTKRRTRRYARENAEAVYLNHRKYAKKNAEKDAASKRKWVENNPDKVREAGNRRYERILSAFSIPYSKEDFISHLEDFDFQCVYCQEELNLTAKNSVHLDHFIALSKGGNNHLGNYVPACRSCNLSKSDKHPYVWYKEQSFFNRERWRHILAVLWKHQERYELYERDIIQLIQFT